METFRSDIFQVPAATYAKACLSRKAGSGTVLLIIPVAIGAIAGFADIRWWLVTLMLLLLVYPMAITMAWLSMMGKPAMAMRLRPQRWTIAADGNMSLEFFHFEREDNPEPVNTETASIASISPQGQYTAVRLKPGNRFDFLLIPSRMMPPTILNTYCE